MGLIISLIQTNPVWEDKKANLGDALRKIKESDGQLVALPEMFSTGFSMNSRGISETMDGQTLSWLRDSAVKTSKAIVTSIPILLDDNTEKRYVNRLFFIRPDGSFEFYDKHHLFRMGGENESYSKGETPRLVTGFGGFRILPVICYDLRFPVWLRNRADYDLLINVASWASARRLVWNTLLRARAIENVAYVAGVNRTGTDPSADYVGDSAIYDFKGNSVAVAEGTSEQTITAELDIEKLGAFREKFPVNLDADDFELI